MSTELTVVVPAYNEAESIEPLIDEIRRCLGGIDWELIVVDDDSPDGTARRVREQGRRDPRIRCLQRLKRRGLASACIEGFLASNSPCFAVLDADLQHDVSVLPMMYHTLRQQGLDIVIGSRYLEQGSIGTLSAARARISRIATGIARFLFPSHITDPMSGFFIVRSEYLEGVVHQLHGRGFKILLDILVSPSKPARCMEVPYVMRQRKYGQSKLGSTVIWEFFTLLIAKSLGRYLPVNFMLFITVGMSGMVVQLLCVALLYRVLQMDYAVSLVASIFIAMTNNYTLNNLFTFRTRMLRGWNFFRGLWSFYLACLFGAMINFSVVLMFHQYTNVPWWLANCIGALSGAVWNYATTSTFTWKRDA